MCHRGSVTSASIAYDRKQIILVRSDVADGLGGKYVAPYHFPDGRLEVRSKGISLPYRTFSKDQRVSHTAVSRTICSAMRCR